MGVFSKKSHPRLTRLGALQWLEKRSNFEQQPIGQNHKMAFTLARMRTLLRAIGYESDRDILSIFGLSDEVKVSKSGLKKYVGRTLAARVLKSWVDDFVDEDTGELVPIERNEVILERDIVYCVLNDFL